MAHPTTVVMSAATERIVDEAVVRRMILEVGAQPGPVYGKNGKRRLRERITGYNNAARFSPWIVLIDLDHDAECAPPTKAGDEDSYSKAKSFFVCRMIAFAPLSLVGNHPAGRTTHALYSRSRTEGVSEAADKSTSQIVFGKPAGSGVAVESSGEAVGG